MQTWTLYGHLRQMFRFPTMNDLFWTGFGNPDLDPERGWEAQGGLRKSFQQGYLDAQVFSTQLQHAIIWLPDDFDNWRPVNQSSWDRQGAKLTGHYALGSWILDANLRYVHVIDEEEILLLTLLHGSGLPGSLDVGAKGSGALRGRLNPRFLATGLRQDLDLRPTLLGNLPWQSGLHANSRRPLKRRFL